MTRKSPQNQEVETTGHSWDGIEELNNPLPKWWLYTLYVTIVWAFIYALAYPAWPGLRGASAGFLGFSTRGEVAGDIARFEALNASIDSALAAADLTEITPGSDLYTYALNAGHSVFLNNCAQCHGAGAAGNVGYPNLLDDDWLWGGTLADIQYSVTHGVRNTDDADARYSQMPKFGADGILEDAQIAQVVNYVLQISGQDFDAGLARAGAAVFEDNCTACHGADGTGMRAFGAPDLTDAIWLYGGDAVTLTDSVTNARFGVMPAMGLRLSSAEVNAVVTYVHAQGGGE
ncbi:Cbb3-type cytochrome c oxidase subunit CcoP [Aquimixticola soesokkakensis]|uniref:Cbb3-type cytochrome c oxidase subunit n=1 Tax=Aquimixticola soesokkakensis TaxID=1519096 RepID=A0A1Y5ST20_9RHOB|nr:cytochrome-c oxidase, cbb3-type subunit III [Aquimixticola soesokkakensis]SLN47864.1 Cbb3-type cytochrome c oxidase subunit CcoP [Aquimixticola soesokkakensis]